MSKVTGVTWDGGRETKGISQGKQGVQYDRLGKNGREICKYATWQKTLKSQAGGDRDSLKVWDTQEHMASARL